MGRAINRASLVLTVAFLVLVFATLIGWVSLAATAFVFIVLALAIYAFLVRAPRAL
jgi:hypothetical protein